MGLCSECTSLLRAGSKEEGSESKCRGYHDEGICCCSRILRESPDGVLPQTLYGIPSLLSRVWASSLDSLFIEAWKRGETARRSVCSRNKQLTHNLMPSSS